MEDINNLFTVSVAERQLQVIKRGGQIIPFDPVEKDGMVAETMKSWRMKLLVYLQFLAWPSNFGKKLSFLEKMK